MRSALISIDSESTRDIDDAFAIERAPAGGYETLIAIAHVSYAVVPGSGIDLRARGQGCTIYRGDKAIASMLPRSLAEEQLPLRAGRQRQAMLIKVNLDAALEVTGSAVSFGEIRVAENLTYPNVPELLKGDSAVSSTLRLAEEIARRRLAQRRARGALALLDLTRFVASDEEGNAVQYTDLAETIGHVIVQELMILANEAVAGWAAINNVPLLFRAHQPRAAAPSSAELARELETWLQSGSASTELARKRLALVAERARYTDRAFAHYALNLPAYVHATSPIRRYADLLNQQQIAAHLEGRSPPYAPETLGEVADALNEVLVRHREDRSGAYKERLAARAEDALSRGYVHRLADHELVAVVKLGVSAGAVPEVVADECARRIGDGSAGDRLFGVLLGVGRHVLPPSVRVALVEHVVGKPARAVSLLMHAMQRGDLERLECESTGGERSFSANLYLRIAGGADQCLTGAGARKKDAEQAAYVRAFCAFVGAEPPEVLGAEVESGASPTGSPKSQLLEYCQKCRWPMPAFRTQQVGTIQAPAFQCTVVVQLPDRVVERSSAGCSTKNEAERQASAAMLEALSTSKPASVKAAPSTPDRENPVGAVLEWAAKSSLPAPLFEFRTSSLEPPRFTCEAIAESPSGRLRAAADASNKKEAKRLAAAQLLAAIHRGGGADSDRKLRD